MERYEFGEFTLDVAERRLSRLGELVALAPKTYDVLITLVRNAGHLVPKRDLLRQVWPECFVEENILAVHISALRKALGDPSWIETMPRSGYRFVKPAISPGVLEQCERGRASLQAASMAAAPNAVAAFQAAIELNAAYAPAHAGLALAWRQQAQLRVVPHGLAYERAKAAALTALALDPASADAQVALGTVLFVAEWNWAAAERSFRRALESDPVHVDAYLEYGSLAEARGELERALELKHKALQLRPHSPLVLLAISMSYWHQRRYDDSIDWANRALRIDPRHMLAREHLAGAYWMKGDYDRQMQVSLEHAETHGAPGEILDELRRLYAEGGRAAVVRYGIEHASPNAHLPLAILYAEARETDQALRHLTSALDERDPCVVHLAVAPQWDSLRSEARFEECLARMGLPGIKQARAEFAKL
ncbi:MAG: winged helix-turn-helix domain-containing protein [Bryobacterales bacterium]|nr:winged helix-turn-helix domain-containing protein [Bryobacterales bacterium]